MADLPLPENGDVWLNKDTNALKYKLNDTIFTQPPQTWFVAGHSIIAGDFVSMATVTWPTTTLGSVYKTDSKYADKVLGIALNSATVGQPVEVQREGRYKFDSPPAFFADHIGYTVYIADSPDGTLITDRDTAALDGNNLLAVGQVMSVDTLLIKIEGDSRGPLGYSENQYTLGENINVTEPLLLCQKSDGKVYLASKNRSVERNSIVGFIISSGNLLANSKVLVRRLGLLSGFSGLIPGKPVYASGTHLVFGTITQDLGSISPFSDSYCYVGTALSTTEVIISVQPPYDITDTSPIGSITLIDYPNQTTADSSNLLMNGQVLNAVTNPQYQDLYNVIGNKWGGTNNTDFVLGDLNGGSLKYQIKYKNFYQLPSYVAPAMRIEHPSYSSWLTYANSSILVDITSFGLTSIEELKELNVKVLAKKGSTIVTLPDLFQYNNVTEKSYGYSVDITDVNQIRIILAQYGLAYTDASNNLIALDNTWSIKVIVTRENVLNRYRDSDQEYKLNTLWDSQTSDEGLRTYWSFDEISEIPDSVPEYYQDNFVTDDSWVGVNANISVADEKLTAVSTVTSPFQIERTFNFTSKVVRLRIKNSSGTRTNYSIRYYISSDNLVNFTIPAVGEVVKEVVLPVAGTATKLTIRCDSSGSVGDSFTVDWVYVGTGEYTTPVLDNSGFGINGTLKDVLPSDGISGRSAGFNGSANSYIEADHNITSSGPWSLSFWFNPGTQTNANATVFGLGVLDTNPKGIVLRTTDTGVTWKVQLGAVGGSYSSVNLPSASGFRHVQIAYSGTTYYVYQNGVLVASGTQAISIPRATFRLGQDASLNTATSYFVGSVDELRFYNRLLTAAESRLLYLRRNDVSSGGTFSKLRIVSKTDSSSKDTGALVVEGGVGIEKKLFVGSDVTAIGNLQLTGVSTEDRFISVGKNRTGDGNSYLDFISDATYSNYGLRLFRSASNNGVSYIEHRGTGKFELKLTEASNYELSINGVVRQSVATNGDTVFSSVTESTSKTTGALVCSGGVGIDKNLFVGGNGDIGGTLKVHSTTESSSTTTGAAIIDGGLGVAEDIYATRVFNAVWNDIADFIEVEPSCSIEYGKAYCYDGENHRVTDSYAPSNTVGIASDTYGYGLGKDNKKHQLPIAIGGFVLAYTPMYKNGTPLVAGKDGKLKKASLFVRIIKPHCILATFYKEEKNTNWNGIKVNGRNWVKVR